MEARRLEWTQQILAHHSVETLPNEDFRFPGDPIKKGYGRDPLPSNDPGVFMGSVPEGEPWKVIAGDTCYGALGAPNVALKDNRIFKEAADAINRFLVNQVWVARASTLEEYELAKMAYEKSWDMANRLAQNYFASLK